MPDFAELEKFEGALHRPMTARELLQHGTYLVSDREAGFSPEEALANVGLKCSGTAANDPDDVTDRHLDPSTLDRAKVLKKLYARMAAKEPKLTALRRRINPAPCGAELADWVECKRCEALGIDDLSGIPGAEQRPLPEVADMVIFPHPDPKGPQFLVPADSLLGEIATTVARLVEEYPWRPWRVTRWLVCGDPMPQVVSVTANHRMDGLSIFDMGGGVLLGDNATPEDYERIAERWRPGTDTRWRITLAVDPALSPAEVAAIYLKVRRQIAPKRRLRPLDAKRLALAEFVLDQPEGLDNVQPGTLREPIGTEPEGQSSDVWDRWLDLWNHGPARAAPDGKNWRYDPRGQGRWDFRRDAKSALTRLRYAGWHIDPPE